MIGRVLRAIPVGLRILFGAMLVMSGVSWLGRLDMAGYLADAIGDALNRDVTFGFYRPFLEAVVLPRVGVFASLVALGELLSGVSLLLGAGARLGASVASFQFLNYGLLGGPMGMLSHGVMIAVLMLTLVTKAGRTLGVDQALHGRWPHSRLF